MEVYSFGVVGSWPPVLGLRCLHEVIITLPKPDQQVPANI